MYRFNHGTKRLRRALAQLLILLLLPLQSAGIVAASDPAKAGAPSGSVIAEWNFNQEVGDSGIFQATGGQYQSASILQNIGGTFENFDKEKQEISYQGWDEGSGHKYWLATVSTSGYRHIALSSEQNSSGSGPNDFKVQVSTDHQATWNDVPNGTIQMNVSSSYDCPKQHCRLVDLPLPDVDDKELLYIRWIVGSNTAANTEENPSGIGGGGSSSIRNIRVTGDPIPGQTAIVPTIDLTRLPGNAVENAPVNVPLTVKFNKTIVLNEEKSVAITDDNNQSLSKIKADVVNGDTLQISHPSLAYGKTYKVSIPRGMIKGTDNAVLVRDIAWSFTTQHSPTMPKMINMTYNGDPKTSIALTWYTDQLTKSILQVIEASKAQGNHFSAKQAVEFVGHEEEISTFVTKNDRASGKKTKFVSHKASANRLKPGTTYLFRVGNGGEWSAVGSFTTDTAANKPFRFIVGSDSQASSKTDFEPWADTFKKAYRLIGDPKFLINAGDLVDNGDLEEQWQWMLGLAQQQLLNVPIVPVLGGHEVTDWDGDETTPNNNFYNHFNLPKNIVKGTHDGSVYSFEYGDALFMVMNSQFDGKLKPDGTVDWNDDRHEQFTNQLEWMRSTVAKSDKKWKFVTFHKAPYAAGDNSAQWEDERVQFYRKHLIPVFDELGIDMVFEAHDHMYMRSFQMLGNKVIDPKSLKRDAQGNVINPKGTIYLMSNAFGNKFYYKNNQYRINQEGEPEEIVGSNNKPVPYDDFFAAINAQPEKKMFTAMSVTEQVLSFDAYTAAVEDEGKPGYTKDGLRVYDQYAIKRTDVKPAKAEAVKVKLKGGKAILAWKLPSASKEPIRGFRIYEKNDKLKRYWSVYIPVVAGKTQYSYTIDGIDPAKPYDFVIKTVGRRDNSAPVQVSTKK